MKITDKQRAQLMKLVAVYCGGVSAVEGYEDWLLYAVHHADLGKVVYDDEDEDILIKGKPLTKDQFKILDEHLVAKTEKLVKHLLTLLEKAND